MLGIDWYKRWRHGHGFGVHSPSAYVMVRDVLRPARCYAYYAYDDIASARGKYPTLLSLEELKLIYRILIHLQPESVAISSGPSHDMLRHIVRMALPTAVITRKPSAKMAIYEGKEDCVEPKEDGYAYFTDSSNPACARLADSMTRGHIYVNTTRALAVLNPKLPRQEFKVNF